MPAALVSAAGNTAIATRIVIGLARVPVAGAAVRTVGQSVYVVWANAAQNPIVRAVWRGLQIAGIITVPITILDAVPGVDIPGFLPDGGNQSIHPGQVVKSWTANGVAMVRLADGRMGAFSKKRNSWKYWRPKKPIVLYSGGSSNLKTLLKADRATERQLRSLKKAIDRRFPSRPRSRQPHTTVIQETGPGSVQHSPRS